VDGLLYPVYPETLALLGVSEADLEAIVSDMTDLLSDPASLE